MFGKPVYERNFRDTVEAFRLLGYECDVDPFQRIVRAEVQGDDLPILIIAKVEDGYITFVCKLAFEATPDSYRDAVWSLNDLNDDLEFGAFILDAESGWLSFHYSVICGDNRMSRGLLAQIITMVVQTVDERDGDLKKVLEVSADRFRDVMFQ